MTEQFTERNKEIVKLSEKYNMTEISEMMKISRERVRQILESHGVTKRNFLRGAVMESIERIKPLLGTMTDSDIARELNVEKRLVWRVRNNLHIKRFLKVVGCDRCKTDPYAKGMCRNCYALHLSRSKNGQG